ncbi:MAG: hypothetical protein LAT82_01375 [Nanoarchaeota archaeon]|nr:hypothetical protein [Nanoarchaeota archaeon]
MNTSKEFLFEQEATLNSLKKEFQEEMLQLNPHALKVSTKVDQILLKNIQNQREKLYYYSSFYPTTNKDEILKRQQLFQESVYIFANLLENSSPPQLTTITNIHTFEKTLRYPFECYTTDVEIHTLFSEYISIFLVDEKEIRKIEEEGSFSSNTFIISDERYLGEIEQLRSKELSELLQGFQNSTQLEKITLIHENLKSLESNNLMNTSFISSLLKLFNIEHTTTWDFQTIEKCINYNVKEQSSKIISYVQQLPKKVELKNKELQQTIKNVQMQLQGDDLIELLESNNVENLQKKLQGAILHEINEFEDLLHTEFKELGFSKKILFESKTYPLKLNEETMYDIQKEIEEKENSQYIEYYMKFSTPTTLQLKEAVELLLCYDLFNSMYQIISNFSSYPSISKTLLLEDATNIFIKNSTPISYALNATSVHMQIEDKSYKQIELQNEKVSVLTGANSGGKTTLLELILSTQYLFQSGFPINCKNSQLPIIEEIIYLKKFTGTQGSGAFEQTIRELLTILSTPTSKLLLIDEFEAITEPGAAASILTYFLSQISNSNHFDIYCIGVSHLGKDIKQFIETNNITGIRIDGISATGLDERGNLITNHQPIFNELGKSTPELILKRIYNDETFFKDKNKHIKELLQSIINSGL